MTINDLIKSSLRMIGRLGPGRQANTSETADALIILNSMLDAWSAERLNIYSTSIDLYTLTPSLAVHTLGVTGDLDGPRPVEIVRANLLLLTDPVIHRELRLLTDTEWASRRVRTITTMPTELYNDGSFPFSNIYLYPIPDAAYGLELFNWNPFVKVFDTTVDVDFPPGYASALRTNLAVEICEEWGKPVPPGVLRRAIATKAVIQSANVFSPRLITEPGLIQRGGGFNWLSREIG
jgi:hypothetical protein